MTDKEQIPITDQRANDIAALRQSATAFRNRADVRQELERLLGAQLGVTVRHKCSEMVVPPRNNLRAYIRTGRTHTKHVFSVLGEVKGCFSSLIRGGRLEVFVKAGSKLRVSPLDELLNGMVGNGVRQPYFWGSVMIDDGTYVGAWEFIEGVRTPFEELPLATQVRLVHAIANYNSIAGAEVPRLTKWVTAPFDWYEGRFRRFSDEDRKKWRDALDRVEGLLGRGDLVKDVIGGYGERLLTHNDINPNNVFTPPEGDVVVFDWEGSTLSVPGADLRFLVRMAAKDVLLNCYVDKVAECGIRVATKDVRRAFEIVEGFRRIYKGWAAHNINSVLSGLVMAEAHVSPPAASVAPPAQQGTPSRSDLARKVETTNRAKELLDGGEEIMVMDTATTTRTTEEGSSPSQSPSPELVKKIEQYVIDKGALYAPVDHPAFAALPCRWGADRFDLFAPHLEYQGGTALDIGSHWGYMAQRLEKMGYKVAACEHSPKHAYFLRELRNLSGFKFEVIEGDIFAMAKPDFDVMIALNIFHHFLKTDQRFDRFKGFLDRTQCRMMIYQAHRSAEKPKLDVAGHYMEPHDMAKFIADRLRLSRVIHVGVHGKRDIFKLAE